MDTRTLAAQIYLDMLNGQLVAPEQARQLAISAWENARIFDAQDPQAKIPADAMHSFEANMERKLTGCRACFGSGGKANKPCVKCAGTGKVPAK